MNEHHQPFEEIKLINANGAEQWSARQLGKLLGYSEYRHFIPVLTRAKEACLNSGHTIDDHFEEILDMVKIGSNAKRALKTSYSPAMPVTGSTKRRPCETGYCGRANLFCYPDPTTGAG